MVTIKIFSPKAAKLTIAWCVIQGLGRLLRDSDGYPKLKQVTGWDGGGKT